MIRDIVTYPNPILRKKSKDVEVFDKELHTLLDDMNDTMMSKNGVGLAAIQIAVPLNVLIINIPIDNEGQPDDDTQIAENLIEAINPIITHKDGELVFSEGCLSVPGFHADVTRAKHVIVEYYNRDGEKQTMEAHDFLAVAWQHEMEHLSGHVFVENLSFLKRKKFEKEWKRELKEKSKGRNL
ncbi:MAG: peptide deformylase [Campylobacterota bacterium]|nr:peptide deformylase [Campylobacterota bacterium]